jgi:hypothetical protein
MAFGLCVGAVNNFLAENGTTGVGIVENTERMAWALNNATHVLKSSPVTQTMKGFHDGVVAPMRFSTDRFPEPFAFLPKSEKGLQIADACAYAIRRFLSDQKFGRDFIKSLGGDANLHFWDHAMTQSTNVGIVAWPDL